MALAIARLIVFRGRLHSDQRDLMEGIIKRSSGICGRLANETELAVLQLPPEFPGDPFVTWTINPPIDEVCDQLEPERIEFVEFPSPFDPTYMTYDVDEEEHRIKVERTAIHPDSSFWMRRDALRSLEWVLVTQARPVRVIDCPSGNLDLDTFPALSPTIKELWLCDMFNVFSRYPCRTG